MDNGSRQSNLSLFLGLCAVVAAAFLINQIYTYASIEQMAGGNEFSIVDTELDGRQPTNSPIVLMGGRSATVQVPEQGIELGYGWDSRYGTAISNRCIEFAPVSLTGQTTTVHLTEVSDKSEIMEALGVSASVSVKTMFGAGGAKASFARNSSASTSNETLLLNATVLNGSVFVGPPRPAELARSAYPNIGADHNNVPGSSPTTGPGTAGARGSGVLMRPWAARLARDNPALFRKTCGDSYLASIDTGASLVATFTITSSDTRAASSAKAAIEASYGPVAASAEASASNSSAITNARTEIEVIQVGGSSGPIPTTVEGLQNKLGQLAEEAARAPIFQTMEVRSYDGLANWPSDASLTSGEDDAEIVADHYWFLASFYDAIEDVLENPNDYSFQTGLIPAELARLQDEVVQLRAAIRATIGAITGLEEADPDISTSFELGLAGATKLEIPSAVFSLPDGSEEEASSADAAYASFADALRAAALFGSPNTLRLKLPVPAAVAESARRDGIDPRQAAVDHYVARQAKRMCRLEPTDNECLTNAELEALRDEVPVSQLQRPDRAMLQNIGDGSCLHHASDGRLASVACTDVEGDDRAVFAGYNGITGIDGAFGPIETDLCAILLPDGIAAVRCQSVAGHGHGFLNWSFEENALTIKIGDNCLVSAGVGSPAAARGCTGLVEGRNAQHKWRVRAPVGD